MRRILGLSLLALWGCNGTPPPPPPTTTTTVSTTTVHPRHDSPADLRNIRGVTAFGASLLSEEELIDFIEYLKASGYNTMRVGAQTDGWCSMQTRAAWMEDLGMMPEQPLLRERAMRAAESYLVCGPKFGSEEWEANLRRLLEVSSRYEGVWVQLIPTFTHKQDTGGLAHFMEMTERVIAIVESGTPGDPTPLRNVVYEAANEYVHPISNITHEMVKALLVRLRETGLPVGTDRSGGRQWPWEGYYPEDLLPLVDYVAFHPPRNRWENGDCVDELPGDDRLRAVVRKYAQKPVWFDETIAWISDAEKARFGIAGGRDGGHYSCCGLRSEGRRRKVIAGFKAAVEEHNIIWFAHATWLFACKPLGWLP